MKVAFVADFFANEICGGGELNNEELIQMIRASGHYVSKIKAKDFGIKHFTHDKYIISNYVSLSSGAKEILQEKGRYSILEHDHQYLSNRNPAGYENFIATFDDIINLNFYEKATKVYCQSQYHVDIVKRNLNIDNIVNLGGNLWSLETLDFIEKLSLEKKSDKTAILNSVIPNKNTSTCISFCIRAKKDYELISSSDNREFLRQMSLCKELVFLPNSPETLSRLVVEARMLGLTVITNKLVGAAKEEFFKMKGRELIQFFRDKRGKILSEILNFIEEE